MTSDNLLNKNNNYSLSITISLVLFFIGLIIQYTFGSISKTWFSFPNNIYFGISFIATFTFLYLKFKNKGLIILFSSIPFAICMIIGIGILTVGLGSLNIKPIPIEMQKPNSGLVYKLGLENITTTWYFGFFYVGILINLWFVILKRSLIYKNKNITFLLNHFGLWLILFGGVLGQGDIVKLKMTLQSDVPEWRGVNEQGKIIELPLALELKKFKMDLYPNKLFIINEKGKSLPESKPVGFQLEKINSSHQFEDWNVTLLEFIENAVPTSDKSFSKNPMWGSTSAAKVVIENLITKKKTIEWISCGNFQLPPKAVSLSKNRTLVMASAEPKKYESEVLVYQKNTINSEKRSILVNQPLSIAGWKIYQTSYDEKLGKWSDLSIVELVHDPWLPIVYLGIFILMLGTLSFLINNSKS